MWLQRVVQALAWLMVRVLGTSGAGEQFGVERLEAALSGPGTSETATVLDTIIAKVVRSRKPVIISDAMNDDEFAAAKAWLDTLPDEFFRGSDARRLARALVAVTCSGDSLASAFRFTMIVLFCSMCRVIDR